jgi:hypothetical protein
MDAQRIAREELGFGSGDADRVELQGIVSDFASIGADFTVAGVTVDGSGASLEPSGLVLADGIRVEVEGRLVAGRLIADHIQSEEAEDNETDSEIRAQITSIDAGARTLVALGVTVVADGETALEDGRDDLSNFRFTDIATGDWLDVAGRADGTDVVVARSIKRRTPRSDVVLEGPVTALDTGAHTFSVLGQPVAPDALTQYRAFDASTDEDGFFAAVALDDVVKVTDQGAADPAALDEIDQVELED